MSAFCFRAMPRSFCRRWLLPFISAFSCFSTSCLSISLSLQLVFVDIDKLADFWRLRFRRRPEPAAAISGADKSPPQLSYTSSGALAAIIGIFLLGWVWRAEYYPLTSWHLYATPERRRPVSLYENRCYSGGRPLDRNSVGGLFSRRHPEFPLVLV
jgi:hypothetical protein